MPGMPNRRAFIKGIGAAGATATLGSLAGCIGDDDDDDTTPTPTETDLSDETLRIGMVQPTSGVLDYYGQISLMGFYSGLAYKYDDIDPIDHLTPGTQTIDPADGPEIELILNDSQFDSALALEEASELVAEDEVDLLFGVSDSSAARSIIDEVVAPTDTPFIIGPAADADITNGAANCHELAFRASENTAMDARAGAVYAAEEAGVETVAIFAADYEFGHSVEESYRQVLEEVGIEVLDPWFVEQEYAEFGGIYEEAINQGAEGVVGGFTFATLPAFLTAGIDYDIQIFGGFAELVTTQAIGGAIESALGEDFTAQDIQDAGLGPFTTRYHWNQYDNPINDAFIDMHIDAYDLVPDLFSAGTFVGATALVEAMEAAGTTDAGEIAEAMQGMTVQDTPKGEGAYTFQEFNNQAASEMTVAWPEPTSEEWAPYWGATTMPGEPVERIPASDTMTPEDEVGCSLN